MPRQGFIDVPLTPRQRERAVAQPAPQASAREFEDVPLERDGLVHRVVANASDYAGGVRASLASTVYGGGDVLRRGFNALVPERFEMDRIINEPDVQTAMAAPPSMAGRLGRFTGDAAQYAIPVSRAASAVKGAPLLVRALAEGGASAGVAAAQSAGDPGAITAAGVGGAVLPFVGAGVRMSTRLAQRAASGAREGGVGGAIASAVRTVAPGEPRTLLTQALKPRSVRTNFPAAIDTALPDLHAAETVIGRPIASLADLQTAIGAAKRGLQQQLGAIRGQAGGLQIDGASIADAMATSIPRKLRLENPEAVDRLLTQANVYRRSFSLEEMETLLRETNAELDGLMSMFPRNRYAAITSNPAAAALDAQAKAMRTAIDDGLNNLTAGVGDAAKALRRRYGALLELDGEATRRMNVAARQQPESLSEQIGAVRAAADMARGGWRLAHGDLSGAADIAAAHAGRSAGKAIKDAQTTDALIRRAFDGYRQVRGAASRTAQGAR